MEKIDTHIHINSAGLAFLEQAQADDFKILSINVDYSEFPSIKEQGEISIGHLQAYPDHFAYASTFEMKGWDEPDWQGRVINQLDETFVNGAVAVKVWKNIGMDIRDKSGKFVMIDNHGFDRIFAYLQQNNIPLIGHLGEPKNCWLPIEEITIKFEREYFATHPQYHMYLHPEFPSYKEQMVSRDRMLEKNRQLSFIGAHFACLEWSIEKISRFLDRFPRAVVDTAERMMYLQYHSIQNRQKVRNFIIRYQDRILYGSDLVQDTETDPDEFKKTVHNKWLKDWKYLVTDDIMQSSEFDGDFKGLALPGEVVKKIYRDNALKMFPNAWNR